MGFFSSLGSVLGGGLGFLVGGTPGAMIGGSLGGALGGDHESRKLYNSQMGFAQSQAAFQQDYIRNAMQWRAEDAKKAGFHPMAALGFSSPSYSPVSAPSSSMFSSGHDVDPLEFGQQLNYAATKAKDKKQQADMIGLQMEGLRLDNEMKRAQIDQAKVDALASSIATDQALRSPGAPSLNSQSPIGTSDVTPNTYGDRVHNLYSLARYGDIMLSVLNPDIADSLTESQISHLTTILAREVEHGRNPEIYRDALDRLPKEKQKAVADGRALFEYIPAAGVYMLTYPQKRSKNGREISGKLRLE